MTDDTDSVDRPALKLSDIEITPEMIRAGVKELLCFNREMDSEEYAVYDIFVEMMRANKPNLPFVRIKTSGGS